MEASKEAKKNWSVAETNILVDRCVDNIDIVSGAFSTTLSDKDKDKFWKDTTVAINSVGYNGRRDVAVKKKWIDLKSLTKKKEQERRKRRKATGGGPPLPPLSSWEEKIISILPPCLVDGICGGRDTFEDCSRVSESLMVSCAEETSVPELPGRTATEVMFHKAILETIAANECQSVDKQICDSGKEALGSGKEESGQRSKKPRRGNSLQFDQCTCSKDLIEIQQQLLLESRKRNSLLGEISSSLQHLNKYKEQKLQLLKEQQEREREEELRSTWGTHLI